MSQKIFTLSTIASLVLGATSAIAATPVSMKAGSVGFLNQQFKTQTALSVTPAINSLEIISNNKDFNHTYHQRLQQMYHGVPVIGGYAIIHSKQANGFATQQSDVSGKVFSGLEQDLAAKPADNAAAALTAWSAQDKGAKISDGKAELVVFVDQNNQAHWAYQVSYLAEDGKSIPKRPSAYLDAKTFKPFVQWNDIKTAKHSAYGKGFGGNERVGQYAYDSEASGDNAYSLLEISRDDAAKKCYMETSLVKVIDMDSDYYSNGKPMTFDCAESVAENTYMTGYSSNGYDEVNGAFSPSNDAMYIGQVIHHMYRDWYDVDALQNRDGSTMQVVMRVHYGQHYENAFWDGKQMTYGDGGSMMYPLVSMGVGAHEISHGFTQQHSNLQYYGQSGGMNESFSDMAAMGAIFYSYKEAQAPSFKIGDRIMKKSSGYDALRYMDKPSRDGRSIDSADDYHDGLDVHYSSGVFNRMFYLLATTDGWNTRKAFDVMVKANSDYWTPYEKFQSGGCAVLKATADYGYSVADAENAMTKVGLKPAACSEE